MQCRRLLFPDGGFAVITNHLECMEYSDLMHRFVCINIKFDTGGHMNHSLFWVTLAPSISRTSNSASVTDEASEGFPESQERSKVFLLSVQDVDMEPDGGALRSLQGFARKADEHDNKNMESICHAGPEAWKWCGGSVTCFSGNYLSFLKPSQTFSNTLKHFPRFYLTLKWSPYNIISEYSMTSMALISPARGLRYSVTVYNRTYIVVMYGKETLRHFCSFLFKSPGLNPCTCS